MVACATIGSAEFCDALARHGFDFFTGVPCSIFGPLYEELAKRPQWGYLPATREDAAVGIAVGAYLAGRRPVVVMQNSGLGYSLNAFTSLALIYEIPILVLVSWRGYRGQDEPEHLVMGAHLLDVLASVGIPYIVLGEGDSRQELKRAADLLAATAKPVAVVVRKGVLL